MKVIQKVLALSVVCNNPLVRIHKLWQKLNPKLIYIYMFIHIYIYNLGYAYHIHIFARDSEISLNHSCSTLLPRELPFRPPTQPCPAMFKVPKVAGLDSFFRRGSMWNFLTNIHPVSTELGGGFKHSASVLLTNLTNKWRNKWFQTRKLGPGKIDSNLTNRFQNVSDGLKPTT